MRRFPRGFRWGTATSSHQVEGDNTNNDWWLFEQQPGRIRDGSRSGVACDWWHRAEEDFDRMRALHQNAHRLSLEWSRLEPEPGRWDEGAEARYRQMLRGLWERGIEPMVTLHHFTLPLWVARQGGWENPEIVRWFARHVKRCAEAFGEFVSLWVPINEPNVVVALGYLHGKHPPAVQNPLRARRAIPNLLRAHAAAYRILHEVQPGARVGTAHNLRPFDPVRSESRLDRWITSVHGQFFNWMWLEALHHGLASSALGTWHLPECAGAMDFVGVNYYTRDRLRFAPWRVSGGLARAVRDPGALYSDGDYGEVYPEGLYRVVREVWMRYRKPVFVTENGLPDADDDLRPGFLLQHLAALHRAIEEGADVRGYYHWSIVDNFEWAEGWSLRFGLIAVDPHTQARTFRPSAHLYAEICARNALPG
ncbi:MAG: glycoside hydrolase family 1 protein [Armatimonadota bacterium]|nr:glycoside hydrolase family 1 protein [Armatimonadota bacterium]MDR7614130.1 glycoside hydrolase family 1 protein [Armatimonadota bacterium]